MIAVPAFMLRGMMRPLGYLTLFTAIVIGGPRIQEHDGDTSASITNVIAISSVT